MIDLDEPEDGDPAPPDPPCPTCAHPASRHEVVMRVAVPGAPVREVRACLDCRDWGGPCA